MQAITHQRYGNPDVLRLKQLPIPQPGPGELLIKVQAAGVNRTDCHMLTAKPFIMRAITGWLRPRKPIPGSAFAGRVEALSLIHISEPTRR